MTQPLRPKGTTLLIARNLAIAAVFGLTAITLAQCRTVADNITGIRLTAGTLSGRSHCTHDCNEAFEAAMRVEEHRHRDAKRACGHDSNCRKAEDVKNHQNEDKIRSDRKACKKACYNEGGGQGQ